MKLWCVSFLFFCLFRCRSGFGLRGVDGQGTQTGEMGCVFFEGYVILLQLVLYCEG